MASATAPPPTPPGPQPEPGVPAQASPGLLLMLLQAAWSRPQGLGSHLTRYAHLLQRWLAPSRAALQQRALLSALAWSALMVAAGLGGGALMLWVALPLQGHAAAWVLLVVPLVPLAVAAWAVGALRRLEDPPLWEALSAQWRSDMALLQQGPPSSEASGPVPAPTTLDLLTAGAREGSEALLRPLAREHPWALVGAAALAGALLIGGRPWRALLRPSLLASLGAQWALRAWVESRLAPQAAPPGAPRARPPPQPFQPPPQPPQPTADRSAASAGLHVAARVMPTPAPRPTSNPSA